MAQRRVVNIHVDTSRLPNNTVEINKAIGYLSMWAIPEEDNDTKYDVVDIYNDGGHDMVANYSCSSDVPGQKYISRYVIGAVWRSSGEKNQYGADLGDYSFHS